MTFLSHKSNYDFSLTKIKLVYCLTRRHHIAKTAWRWVPPGPKQYIFGDHFYSKNAKKFRFHVFLLFHVRKHMTSSFYLKWTEFTRNFVSIVGPRIKLEQIHNFLWIRSTSGKMVICFLALKWRNTWNLRLPAFFE